jgi:putative chitinase
MPTANEIAMLQAAQAAGITSRDELANFMAQISHESGGLTRLEEGFRYTRGIDQIPVQSAFREGREVLEAARLEALDGRPQELGRLMYGGRMGNDDAGDGYLYRGRGFTQLTGEDNYRAAGTALNLDLVNNPDLAAQPENASRIAVWYWQNRVPAADRDDVSAATRAVNGGDNGLADRHNRFDAWHAQLTPEFMADLAAGRVQPGAAVAPVAGQAAMADNALRRGETGAEVGQLQTNLRALGIRNDSNQEIGVDNSFGPGTEQAVRRFQEQQGLPVTGRAGPETLTAVQEAVRLQEERLQTPQSPPQPTRRSLLDDAGHPVNPMYAGALDATTRADLGLDPQQTRNVAGAITAAAVEQGVLSRVDTVAASRDGANLFAIQGPVDSESHRRLMVDRQQAAGQTLDQSTERVDLAQQRQPTTVLAQTRDQALVETPAIAPKSLS